VITKNIKILLMATLLFMWSFSAMAQKKQEPVNRILFIFDASHSMNGEWQSGSKIEIAKKLLSNLLDSIVEIPNLEIGLRVYGNKSNYQNKDCEDTHLEVDFLKPDSALTIIKGKLSKIRAIGTTPIARSLELGAKSDFLFYEKEESRNIVIIITDGKESCDMDPCAVSRLYQRKEIILKPFIVGVGHFDESWKKAFYCVGRFFDASNEQDFTNILNLIISHVIDNTTIQVNLMDENNDPTESNINLTFYDHLGIEKYNYIHKLNNKNPDTMIIDPVHSYRIVAHTIPTVSIDNVKLKPGAHTLINLRTPQGTLNITMKTKEKYSCIIRKAGETNTLHVQKVNTSEKYLIGNYDVEVLSLPRKLYTNVKIEQGKNAILPIPPPALVNIKLPSKGYGGVYVKYGDNTEQIYHFKAEKNQHSLTLLPGNYKVVFRAETAKNYSYSTEKNFKLKSGQSELIKIY
tara:strand:- start:2 stop:1384 length:1383 start_codon:yes stop_codon:yes gene_type:complete